MSICTQCKTQFSLTDTSIVIRASLSTTLVFDCVECLIQYCNDNTNAYWEAAITGLKKYLKDKENEENEETDIPF